MNNIFEIKLDLSKQIKMYKGLCSHKSMPYLERTLPLLLELNMLLHNRTVEEYFMLLSEMKQIEDEILDKNGEALRRLLKCGYTKQ